ncbi:hypothetical protein FOA52_006898 [Chlamydomonas sp. UWO 241]|nr:hypothetical protein FOA52_006898 [Chlamydomonas sp. UWO 241]
MADGEHTSVWSVDRAKSGRAQCKATKDCGQACQELDGGQRHIGKGELRIGRTFEVRPHSGEPFMMTTWMHLVCVSAEYWGKISEPEDLEGFDDLRKKDQDIVLYAYANPSGIVARAREAGHIIPIPASLKKERREAKKRAAEGEVEDENDGGYNAHAAFAAHEEYEDVAPTPKKKKAAKAPAKASPAAAPKTPVKAAAPRPKKQPKPKVLPLEGEEDSEEDYAPGKNPKKKASGAAKKKVGAR